MLDNEQHHFAMPEQSFLTEYCKHPANKMKLQVQPPSCVLVAGQAAKHADVLAWHLFFEGAAAHCLDLAILPSGVRLRHQADEHYHQNNCSLMKNEDYDRGAFFLEHC